MTAQAAYKQFLDAPSTSLLADDAILSYITTTTAFTGATNIIKHYGTLQNQVKKKSEKIIDVIEAQNALWIEISTTLEFVTSGGVYLPNLDDNFLTDRTVTIAIDHVVRFDVDGKIKAIRQKWDQGCLLKQVDLIGRSGRNWPIRDSTEQVKMVTKLKGIAMDEQDVLIRNNRSTSNNAMRDPHVSLSLFGPREDFENPNGSSVISPKAGGSRPPQRSFTEILGDEVPGVRERSPSKAGAGKNFVPNRLFEAQQEEPYEPETPPRSSRDSHYKPNPKKYHHFDFADGSDPHDTSKPDTPTDKRGKSKHDSNWDFEDFVTPQKSMPTRGLGRRQDRVHWSTVEGEANETPVSKPAPPKPRLENESHFQLADDGESHGEPRLTGHRGKAHNSGLGLYKDILFETETESPRALDNITNLKDRRKDFESQFDMVDKSPRVLSANPKPEVSQDRKKAVRMMDASWDSYDESPKQKENRPLGNHGNGNGNVENLPPEEGGRVYQVAGNGMGSRKGARGWSIGDSDEESTPKAVAPKRQNPNANKTSFDWDF